ncbi:hypothetical protein [Microbacter margulisiae]|uniref:Uncharacterized protein n=1 Tax=Microbacter margulisiae TaxID=1350067 RepID=A0A7W5DPX6_9PORP|nr:hypothetical protein [Microbacter margulisiae]MBB3186912.1 hypothetical protein [Microbacter margulisiae]
MKKVILFIFVALLIASCSTTKRFSNATAPAQTVLANNAGRDGSSYQKAIIIHASSESTGVPAEYQWLKNHYPGYQTKMQTLVFHQKKPYDIIEIVTAEGQDKNIYFDISNYFGKL